MEYLMLAYVLAAVVAVAVFSGVYWFLAKVWLR